MICSTLALVTAGAAAQTLRNGGFEADGRPLTAAAGRASIEGVIADGWKDDTAWADVAIAYALDPDRPHSGKLSQKILVRRGFAQFMQPVALPRPGLCAASIWARSLEPSWATLALRQVGPPYADYAARVVLLGPRWQQVKMAGFVPAGPCYFQIRVAAPGSIWLDDAELAIGSEAGTIRLTPPSVPIPRSYFGLHINHLYERPFIPWPDVPFGTTRTVDSVPGPMWGWTEKERGVYDWTTVDDFINRASEHHAQVILNLFLTPKWASADPARPTAFGAGYAAPPSDMAYWSEWVQAAADHCKGRVAAYEIWNEPDLPMFWSGTPARLAEMERVAAPIIRKTDPGALIVAAPISGGNRLAAFQWYDAYVAAGGGAVADVLSVHFYGPTPEDDVRAAATLRSILADHGMSTKPLWNTETGWGYDGKGVTESQARAYLARACLLDWALHVDRFCWYSWSEVSLIGVRPAPNGAWARTPGGTAYAEITSWLTSSRMLSCTCDENGTWTCALRRADGEPARVVWNTDGERALAIPGSWKVKLVRTLTGSVTNLDNGRQVGVGIEPILLERTPGTSR
jgi:hypothetical protein